MKSFFKYAWAVYFLMWFILIFAFFYPLFLILLRNPKNYRKAHKLRAVWGRLIMFFSGLRPRTTFEKPLDKNDQYIFVANHFSYLDILSLNVQLGVYFRFLAKSELAKIPVFNIFFKTIDITVDRNSMRSSVTSFELAGESLKQGDSLGIFPEGGIGRQSPKMVKFKTGAFRMAIENKVKVVPVSIIDNWKRLPEGGLNKGGTPGIMRMIVHAPIDTSNMTHADLPELILQTRTTIQNSFDSLNFDA